MLINVIAILIGALILVGGIYYLIKEKGDRGSRKIYGTATGIGAVLLIIFTIRLIFYIIKTTFIIITTRKTGGMKNGPVGAMIPAAPDGA